MVSLQDLKGAVLIIALIALIGGATAISLDEFQDEIDCTNCVASNATSIAFNVTEDGLVGIGNTTEFLGTIGTIIAVMALVGIVVTAFAFGRR